MFYFVPDVFLIVFSLNVFCLLWGLVIYEGEAYIEELNCIFVGSESPYEVFPVSCGGWHNILWLINL